MYRVLLIVLLAGILYFQFDAWQGRRAEKNQNSAQTTLLNQIVSGHMPANSVNIGTNFQTYPQEGIDSMPLPRP